MLAHVNEIYLCTSVLAIIDVSYVSRFWTMFEAWCGFQMFSSEGLSYASEKDLRMTMVCVHSAKEMDHFEKNVEKAFKDKTPSQVLEYLSKPDLTGE